MNGSTNGSSDEIQPKKQRIDDDDVADAIYPFLTCCLTNQHKIDSVFNVCLEVSDVDMVVNNILANNAHSPRAQASVLVPPKYIKGPVAMSRFSDTKFLSLAFSRPL